MREQASRATVGTRVHQLEAVLSTNTSQNPFNSRLLMGSAVLTALGGMLAALGLGLGGAAVIGAGRRWQQGTEMTPAQLAKHALDAAQMARAAGAGAWRGSVPAQRSSVDGIRTPVA